MLYIDGISLNKIKKEFEGALCGKKVGKVFQESELALSFAFGKLSLVLSCNQSLPIAYITSDKVESLNENFNFILSLKKYFLNAQLTSIEQVDYDRILCFNFLKLNELGVHNEFKLYFEMMGRYSNVIITDSQGKILDLLKKFSIEDNNLRIMLPGVQYEKPVVEVKKGIKEIDETNFSQLETPLYKSIEGIGRELSNYIKDYSDFTTVLNSDISPKCYLLNKKIIFATVLEELSPSKDRCDEVKRFDSFSEMVLFYIENMSLSSAVENISSKIKNTVRKRVKKVEKILENIASDNEAKQNFSMYKEVADILSANLYTLKNYSSSAEVYDFYNDKMVTIELDKKYTIQRNIENYYKKYNKLKRGMESNKIRFSQVTEELNYLKSVLNFIELDSSMENLKLILKELENQGYIKAQDRKRMKNKKESNKISYQISQQTEHYSILYGRNNSENDYLTFKIADKDDLWFHVKDIPGSHVILKCNKRLLNDNLILEAAQTAIDHSKITLGERGIVEYTEKRYVTKPNGARPGFVIFTNQKEILLVKK